MIKWGHVVKKVLYFLFSFFLRLWIRNYIKKYSFCLFIKESHSDIAKYGGCTNTFNSRTCFIFFKWEQRDSNPQPLTHNHNPLLSLKLQISRLFWARSSLTFRQIWSTLKCVRDNIRTYNHSFSLFWIFLIRLVGSERRSRRCQLFLLELILGSIILFTKLHHFFSTNFFFQNLWNKLVKKFIFDNIAGYRPATLLKRNSLSGIFQGFCL